MRIKHESYKTVLTISIALIVLYLIYHTVYFLYLSCILAGLSIFSESIANMIHSFWMKLSKLLSFITPNILLSIIFFLILTPMALLQKLFNKKEVFHNSMDNSSTFYQTIKKFEKSHFEKPW